jgi:glutathione S-transferase
MANSPAAPLTLYGDRFWISPYVFSCFVALHEKGLHFSTVSVALELGEHNRRAYVERAITAKVPALAHGHFWLTESSAIIEYLHEAFPDGQPLLPGGLEERARARQVMSWLRTDLGPLRDERSTAAILLGQPVEPLSSPARRATEKLLQVADVMLASGPYVAGSWSMADADLALMLKRVVVGGDRLSARLTAYVEEMWARPSIRAYADHPRPASAS